MTMTSSAPPFLRYIHILRLLVLVAALFFAGEEISLLFSDEPVALFIDNAIWSKSMSAFPPAERFGVWLIASASSLFWFWALFQFWRLCGLYRQGHVFTEPNAVCFLRVGQALVSMALLNSITVPVMGLYLRFLGDIAVLPDMNMLTLLDINFLVAGLFFWLIARIMQQAARLQEDADLTI